MNLPTSSLLMAFAVLVTGCVGVSVNRNSGGSDTSRRSSDRTAHSVQLLAVDVEFARLSATQGAAEAFSRYADSESVRIKGTGNNVVGRDAFVAELQSLPVGALTWTPRHAEVSSSGDLGWTWGDFVFRDSQGERMGRYVTVWRWRDGGWRIAADIGTTASH